MPDFLPAVPRFAPLPALGQDDFLRLFDRLLPPYYLEPLKNPGPGYEYLQAVGKVMERVSSAVAHMGSGCYIGSATGGSRARGVVRLDRPSDLFGDVWLLPGTLVGTADGYLYQTINRVDFTSAEPVGPLYVSVEALARGWEFNKPGEVTTADGELLPGSITRLVSPSLFAPPYNNFDPTITVRQVAPTDDFPYKVSVAFTQPKVGSTVWVKLQLGYVALAPWVGLTLTIGTEEGQQDRYEVVAINNLTGSVITVQLRLLEAGLNAPGATVAVNTELLADSSTSGGSSQMLDALGADRGLPRQMSYGLVSFTRTVATGSVTITPGSTVATDTGYLYQVLEPATFAAGEFGPVYVRVMPLVLPDAYVANGNPTTAYNIRTLGTGSTTGLAVATVYAYQVEGDEAYRTRIAMLPSVVTPSDIRFYVNQTLGTYLNLLAETWSMREIWDIRFQTAFDTPINEFYQQAEVNVPVPEYSANIFAYDYEPADPLSNRWLDPDRGVLVFALPEVEQQETLYSALAQSLEAIKPAGITLGYILT